MKNKLKPIYLAVVSSLTAFIGYFFSFGNLRDPLAQILVPGASPVSPILAAVCFFLVLVGIFETSVLAIVLSLVGALLAVTRLDLNFYSHSSWGYWCLFWGFLLTAIFAAGRVGLAEDNPDDSKLNKRLRRLTPPATVPFILLLLWQGLVIGNNVPPGIFPSVDGVYKQLVASLPVLLADSYTTFVKEIFFGFSLGFASGFLVGIAIALSTFLQRGFLPFAAAFGAVPIVGLAPVLGRAFGVDWESKAAVVVITTFFPVVLNTVQGLTSVDPMKLELLKAYAAKPLEIFFKLRLPNALPYIFNAFKLSAILSVISVIVAEFLIPGPPVGLGQRISLSARKGAYDVVFAAIFVSSVFSIIIYGIFSWLERKFTGWHPSFREGEG